MKRVRDEIDNDVPIRLPSQDVVLPQRPRIVAYSAQRLRRLASDIFCHEDEHGIDVIGTRPSAAKFYDYDTTCGMTFRRPELAAKWSSEEGGIGQIRVSERAGASDLAIYDRFYERLARGEEELIPSEIVDRLLGGENKVKVWRGYRGLSARELAEKTGLSASYISEIESGRKEGSILAMKKIAEALRLDLDEVV